MNADDTITAISTAIAPSARMIIRLSGRQSLQIACQMAGLENLAPSSAQQAMLSFNNLQCPAWIYAFHAPRSYTGENSVEFHIPGSPVLAKLLLDDLYQRGVRPAEPGEFTARAFFNGKLGLTEAEGVAATIAAGNESELFAARQLLAGELARRLMPITEGLAQTLALIEVGIDFSEEDVTFLASDQVAQKIHQAQDSLDDLVDQSGRFEQLTYEPRLVLAGRPNSGKSSLINALCGHRRAVVSDISGTTRDVLTAELNLPRGRVLLSDVAGLEINAEGEVNQQMQQHAQNAIASADYILMVQDATDERPLLKFSPEQALVVITKSDLAPSPDGKSELRVSAKTGEGLDDLRLALDALAYGATGKSQTLALNRRHLAAIDEARGALSRAADRTIEGAAELVAMDLRDALNFLGSIVGQVTPDDVLGRVFSAFCIGK